MSVTNFTTGGSEMSGAQLAQAIHDLVDELMAKNPGSDRAEVEGLVATSAESFADARITQFVPVLIGQEVERQLRGRARSIAS